MEKHGNHDHDGGGALKLIGKAMTLENAAMPIVQAMRDEELTAISQHIREGADPTEIEQAVLIEIGLRGLGT